MVTIGKINEREKGGTTYAIHGVVTGRNGRPLEGARVAVWWQHIRERQELTAGETVEHGHYQLRYEIPEYAPEPVLLVVEAVSEHLEAPLFSPHTRAAPDLQVDLHLQMPDQSEWATLTDSITPLTKGIALSGLVEAATHQDLTFLATELSKDTETLMRVVVSARLEAAYKVPAPAFYAFLRQRVPASLPSPLLDASQNFTLIDALVHNIGSLIFALSADLQTNTLTAAVALDLVGPRFTAQISAIVADLQALRSTDLLNRPYLLGSGTLAQLLDVAALPADKQQTFAQALSTNTQSMRNFWRTLGNGQHGFTTAEASAIERTLSVGAFVKNFVPLVQNLVQGFSSGTYKTLADLARLSVSDWVTLIEQTGPPPNIDAAGSATPAQVFAAVVHARVTRTYPTAALSSRIAAAALVPPAQQQPLITFFTNNPDLELVKNNIPTYLAGQGDAAFAGISAADLPVVVEHARAFQRVLRVAPDPDVAQNLLSLGITSATQIANMDEQQFFLEATAAGLTKPEANQAFQAGIQRYASVISLYTKLNRDALGLWPKAMGQLTDLDEAIDEVVQRDQSLATLFGSQDYCATDDCTSILSPAAYLCDLLMWLRGIPAGARTALDVLDDRRPDIRHLLLNCPNTDTELPYVDLVNELLADKLSPPIDAVSTSYTQTALADGTTYYYTVTAVNEVGEGAASAQVSATPMAPVTVPAVPTGVQSTPGDNTVTLNWNPVPGASSCNIYWSTAPGVTIATGTKSPGATTPYVHPGLVNGTAYYYVVTAVNALGESPASPQVSATPVAPVTVPAVPTGVQAAAGDTEVTVSWDPGLDASSYNIYWSTISGVTTTTGTKIPGATTPYAQTALVNRMAYYYVVTAVNAAGESGTSAQVLATPALPSTIPAVPADVRATAGDNQVTLNWNPVPGATSYNIYWATIFGVTPSTGTEIAGARNPKWKQTSATRTADELTAAPEYFNEAAYAVLFDASYPFSLPYSAGLDALRTYLAQFKLPLWQVRQALSPLAGATTAELAAVAAERFAIPPHGEDLITTSNPGLAPVAWNTANPVTDLASVPAFLQAASITYESLLELLDVKWVQGGRGVINSPRDTCDTSVQTLSPIDTDFLDRAHRFLRLWLATGYAMWEIDLLLGAPAVGKGTLDQAALATLLTFRQLQDATHLGVDEQLAFYQDIDTATHRTPDGTTTTSLFDRIFLNTAGTTVAPDPDLAAIPTGGPIAQPKIDAHLAPIQVALGVSGADANTLVSLTDDTLTLTNLSLTYRVSALATATGLSIPDLVTVAELLTPPAVTPAAALAPLFATPAATLAFLGQAKAISQSKLSLDALRYLLTPPVATALAAGIDAAVTTITVTSDTGFPPLNFTITIGTEILLVTGVSGAGNTTWTVQRGQQGTAPAPANPGAAVALTGGWATTTQMTQTDIAATLSTVQHSVAALLSTHTALAAGIDAAVTTITVTSDTGFPPLNFTITIGTEVLLVTGVSGAGNTTWTVQRGQQGTAPAPANAGAAVTPTSDDVNGNAIAAVAANAHPSGASGLPNDVASIILQTLTVPGTGDFLLTVLTDPAFIGSSATPTPGAFPNQFLAIQLFDKVAVLVRGVRLVAKDLTWLLASAATYGGLDLTALPVASSQSPLALPALLTTLLVIKLARSWTAAPPSSAVQTLYDLIGDVRGATISTAAAAQTALAAITGWPLADIESFAVAVNLAFPGDYTKPAAYDQLRVLEAQATQAHATGAQLVYWGTVPSNEAAAQAMADGALGVIKSQQATTAAWLTLAPTLMNPLRDNRCQALQAALIGQRDTSGNLIHQDADGLFDYFLTDVQMTHCQLTSRIVQAYIAVQIFVERCLMNLEAPAVAVDSGDQTWGQWEWMRRYRVWEANREVFLYPENWLIESQRPNRTEIFQNLEQEVHQGQATTDYLETVVLNYIDRLDNVAHLQVTGTCEDPNGSIYVVARSLADPPVFYLRSYVGGAWSGWTQIPLDIRAHHAVPALYRGRICVFWLDVKVSNEPTQNLPPVQGYSATPPGSTAPTQHVDKYVTLGVRFSTFRNGSWAPAQQSKGKLFDVPVLTTLAVSDTRSVEALYTVRVQTPAPTPGFGANLFIDVFRRGKLDTATVSFGQVVVRTDAVYYDPTTAVHLARAVFDGRFSDLELRNLDVSSLGVPSSTNQLLTHAQATYGPDAAPLLPLTMPDPDMGGEPGLTPQAGALATQPPNDDRTMQLAFVNPPHPTPPNVNTSGVLLLSSASVPFRVVGPVTDLAFDPASYFFYQDNRRCYWVQALKLYWTGSKFTPVPPSNPASAPYELSYDFHTFYHPFTRLFWNQLAAGGFDLLYSVDLQQNPDQIDPGADVFSFATTYHPFNVQWDRDDVTGADRQFLDFSYSGAFSVYNWELFYHVPLYVARLLSQNQQFDDAQTWFNYIFNPTRPGSDPLPQRFWIPKPLHNLTTGQIVQEEISHLLDLVNQGDPTQVAQVQTWRQNPFNPFVLADLRLGVPYMKSTVMSYLDNLIAQGDNLFSTESREALAEATLLYVVASEMLGPQAVAVTPPLHADESFDQLEPALDAFANAMVNVENVIGGAGAGGGGGAGGRPLPAAHTFYFKIPSNAKLLGYWSTVADRLYKLRHCQTITGAPLQLALFDTPIDPGLLIAAQAAGVDLSSVLSDQSAPLPNYRFTALYPIASDFVGAVRAYGSSLQSALEKTDAGALALLQQTTAQQLLIDGNQILDWQVQQAQSDIDNLTQAQALNQAKYDFNSSQPFYNAAEYTGTQLNATAAVMKTIAAAMQQTGGVEEIAGNFFSGVAGGVGGGPVSIYEEGHPGKAKSMVGFSLALKADVTAASGAVANTLGSWFHRQDTWDEAAKEASIQIVQTQAQINKANLALQVAQQNQALHQEQIDNAQKQIEFLTEKFTADSLYDWMVSSLAATYFESYQLAYQICKALERCYRYELGIEDSSLIRFGYWDSLHKGLLAGETLNHDLRRMQASYFHQNARRYEVSRYVSLNTMNQPALQQLLSSGQCFFDIPEALFDHDYPGHYNRRLTRVSVTAVYPNPGKFDNIKATLTMTHNKVRINTEISTGYAENTGGSDNRFRYEYAAIPQKIVLGNAQDDPGLFLTSISNNISDQRYLPFENAGAISSWHLAMPQANNEINLTTISDVILHLYYTALDGGADFQTQAGS